LLNSLIDSCPFKAVWVVEEAVVEVPVGPVAVEVPVVLEVVALLGCWHPDYSMP
jgi:hypothetical protein